uniref:ShKT domain-containing protein n=1 Tax=Meloidogyne incognita TaxID=6306 RepID=A0A914NBF9_MELIC
MSTNNLFFIFIFSISPFSVISLPRHYNQNNQNQLLQQNNNFQNLQRNSASISSISACLFCSLCGLPENPSPWSRPTTTLINKNKCEDKSNKCNEFVKLCDDGIYKYFLRSHCPYTCGICTNTTTTTKTLKEKITNTKTITNNNNIKTNKTFTKNINKTQNNKNIQNNVKTKKSRN